MIRMTNEISGKEKRLRWYCRILMVIDSYLVVSGYIAWYQTQDQLVSPLIPRSTIDQILADSHLIPASIAAAIFLLAGMLAFSFQNKKLTLLLLGLGLIVHQLIYHYHLI